MPVFAIQTESSPGVDLFIEQSNKRMQDGVKQFGGFKFYTGGIVRLKKQTEPGKDTYIFDMTSVIPKFYNIFLVLFIAKHLVFGLGLDLCDIPIAVLYSFGFFWTRYFLFTMNYLGLRKSGYKGKLKMISDSEAIRRLVYNYSNS